MYMETENFVRTVTLPPTFDAGVVHFYIRTENTTRYISYSLGHMLLSVCTKYFSPGSLSYFKGRMTRRA